MFIIYVTNIFIINAKLKVFYFAMSTTLISLKLALTYCQSRRSMSYNKVEKDLDYKNEILMNVPQHLICPKCKVIRTESTVHCPISDKCIDRYDRHSEWIAGPVGRSNHAFYYAFLFFFWLDTFLVGFIDLSSITVTACELHPKGEKCPLEFFCVACTNMVLHYFSTIFGMVVCLVMFVPSQYFCCKHSCIFKTGVTSF